MDSFIPRPIERVIYVSAARTVAPAVVSQDNPYCRGLQVIMDITAVTLTGTLTVTIDGQDPASGKWYNLLTSAALATVATTVLRVIPELVTAANLIASDVLPKTFRIVVTPANAVSMTYSVGATLLP